MTKFEKLGEKCTSTICHKACPVHYFNEYGAGKYAFFRNGKEG